VRIRPIRKYVICTVLFTFCFLKVSPRKTFSFLLFVPLTCCFCYQYDLIANNWGFGFCDFQGVRREVGIHARVLNKLLLQMQANSLHSKDGDNLINSQAGLPKQLKIEDFEKSLLSQEAPLEPQQANGGLLVKSGNKIRQTEQDEEGISKLGVEGIPPLKESIGHTEIEVIAGASLGFLVALAVYNII